MMPRGVGKVHRPCGNARGSLSTRAAVIMTCKAALIVGTPVTTLQGRASGYFARKEGARVLLMPAWKRKRRDSYPRLG